MMVKKRKFRLPYCMIKKIELTTAKTSHNISEIIGCGKDI